MSKKILRKRGTKFKVTECQSEIRSLADLKLLPKFCRSEVKEVYLVDKKLTTVPAELGNLPQLIELYLAQNPLETLPENVCEKLERGTLNIDIHYQILCEKGRIEV